MNTSCLFPETFQDYLDDFDQNEDDSDPDWDVDKPKKKKAPKKGSSALKARLKKGAKVKICCTKLS